jgi:hypothetical protein
MQPVLSAILTERTVCPSLVRLGFPEKKKKKECGGNPFLGLAAIGKNITRNRRHTHTNEN